MTVSLFAVAVWPADASNAAQAGPGPISITPPASMLIGDLVVVTQQYRGVETFSIDNAGGQSWNTLAERNASSVCDSIVHWARYNGTWAANPQFGVGSGVNALTTLMMVYRPTISAAQWAVDVAQDEQDFAAGTTPFTKTFTGRNVSANTVSVAIWYSVDDNTWGSLSGTGWSKTGLGAQYRNTTGSDQSLTAAYYATVTAAAAPNVSQNQATLGGDFGTGGLITWQQQVPTNNYTITGDVTVSETIAGTMLEGRVKTGAVTIALTIAGTMLEGRVISGSVSVTESISAGMVYGHNYSITGEITVSSVIASGMLYESGSQNYLITGDVTVTSTIAAVFVEGRSLSGAITVEETILSGMTYTGAPAAYTILGDIAPVIIESQNKGVTSGYKRYRHRESLPTQSFHDIDPNQGA